MRVVTALNCVRHSMRNAKILRFPPPPPLRELTKASVLEYLKENKEPHGFIRASLTQKWHTSYLDKSKAELTTLNIDFLDPRFEETCEDGFLKPEFGEGNRVATVLGADCDEILVDRNSSR